MDIWRFKEWLDYEGSITEMLRIGTESESKVDSIEVENQTFYLKREDLNESGSHKDRGMTYDISKAISEGSNSFVISSSGNASISAVRLLRDRSEILHIFLSPKTSDSKLKRLESNLYSPGEIRVSDTIQRFGNISIQFNDRAVSSAIRYSKETGATLLRGSTTAHGANGYMTIAFELAEQIPDVTDIFIPTSSGTTVAGIYAGYKKLIELGDIKYIPRLHICQTEAVNPIAREFDKEFKKSDTSVADSIVDKVAHRRTELISIINETKGYGWVISDKEISAIPDVLGGLEPSNESKLAIASMFKAKRNGWVLSKPVIIMTGSK